MKCSFEAFVRDNMGGNLVKNCRTRADGGYSYDMEAGWTNSLTPKCSQRLRSFMERTGFKIRFSKETE